MVIAILGYAALFILALYQWNIACSRYTFTVRQTHGKRCVYVRSRATGRVTMQTRNVFDLLSLGV